MPYLWQNWSSGEDCRSPAPRRIRPRICGKVGHLARDCRSKGAQKGGKGTKRGRDRGVPIARRSASDLDREMDGVEREIGGGEADKPRRRAKAAAETNCDAEMDAYNKAAATGEVAAAKSASGYLSRRAEKAAVKFRFDGGRLRFRTRGFDEFRAAGAREASGRKGTASQAQGCAARPDSLESARLRFAAGALANQRA